MKRCCEERKIVLDTAIAIAKIYEGSVLSSLSEKEKEFLNLFVAIGIGQWYDGIYKFNP